jgi:hypothetical protein
VVAFDIRQLYGILEKILESIPSVRYVELKKWGVDDPTARRWEVVMNEGGAGRSIRDFSEDMGWLIKQRYMRDANF